MNGRKRVSRRAFLGEAATLGVLATGCGGDGSADGRAAAGQGGSGASGGGGSGANGSGASGSGASGSGASGSGPIDVPAGSLTVSAVGAGTPDVTAGTAELDAAVARAVELAGGLGAIEPGQTVFIKPNAVSDRALGSTGIRTSPEVLAAVVRLVKARDPGRIIVGDRSARSFPNTDEIFEVTGLADAALSAGADEIFAAQSPVDAPDDWVLATPDGWEESWADAGGIWALRPLLEADHVINVPTCKNHRFALFSLSMKNFIGGIGDSSRDPLHYLDSIALDFEPLGREIGVINQIFQPLMNVVDATHALINGGPQGDGADSVRTSPGIIMASRDRVALDVLGVSLLKLELSRTDVPAPDASHESLTTLSPWQLPQIEAGIAFGIGAPNADAVTLALEMGADADALEALFRS